MNSTIREDALRTALALGQDSALIEAIRRGEVHPAMAAFGLWNDPDLDVLEAQAYAHRERQSSPPSLEP